LTREEGKNDALLQRLKALNIECVVLPMVKTDYGPDTDRLAGVLKNERFDWVVVTSPEAAKVLKTHWQAHKPTLRLAVVGEGVLLSSFELSVQLAY
jgi:uroporphyrinogen-III synthase